MIRFPSKIDLWLGAILTLLVAGEGIGGALLLILGPERITGGILVAAAVLVAWLSLTTDYRIDDETLTVRSGPFRWRVPIEGIERIVPTRNPLSSPALSLDRLWIDYRLGEKRRSLMVSPRDQEEFLRALVERNPNIKLS